MGNSKQTFKQSRHSLHWTNCKTVKVIQTLWHYHCPYHPQSSGKAERTNGILKCKLAKLTETTALSWPKVLLLDIMTSRSTSFRETKWIPYKIITG